MATNFILQNEQEIEAYFQEWLEDINAQIRQKNPAHTIADYPVIEEAFKAMQKAWTSSFVEPEIMVRMRHRDAAIQILGQVMHTQLH